MRTPSAAKAGTASAKPSAAATTKRDELPSMIRLLVSGPGGSGPRFAEYQFQEDAGRRPDEQPAFAELRQLHPRIGDAEAVELAPHPVMVCETEGDMVDGLACPVD